MLLHNDPNNSARRANIPPGTPTTRESVMEMLLERLSSGQIVAVISVVSGCIVGLAMIVAISEVPVSALADHTALKREKLQANIAYRQSLLERGETPPASLDELLTPETAEEECEDEEENPEEQQNAELAKQFGSLDLPGNQIEEALRGRWQPTRPESDYHCRDV